MEVGDLSSRQVKPDRAVANFFYTIAAANKAGKAALKQLLAKDGGLGVIWRYFYANGCVNLLTSHFNWKITVPWTIRYSGHCSGFLLIRG